jgi:DNA-binding response OmpR family regulator
MRQEHRIMEQQLKVMVVNDSEEVLNLFYDILHEEEGHEVVLFSYRIRDLAEVRSVSPDLLIIDQVYGKEAAGWELIQKVRMSRDLSNLPIVFCTTDLRRVQELEGHLAAMSVVVVVKPFTVDSLLSAVAAACQGRIKLDRSDSAEPG